MFKICTIALISHASNVALKILQAWLQQYLDWETPEFSNLLAYWGQQYISIFFSELISKLYLEKGEKPEIKLPTSIGS